MRLPVGTPLGVRSRSPKAPLPHAFTSTVSPMTDQDLLKELRISRDDRQGRARGRWPWLIGALLATAAAAVGGYYALFQRSLPVETVIASAPTLAQGKRAVLEATGYVTARRQATVSSKIAGKLADVLIEEGEYVKAGQVLARLDDTDAQAHLDLVKARLAAARAQLGQTEAQLEQAQRDLQRQQELRAKSLTSEVELETQRTQARTLTAQLAAQRSQVAVAEAELKVAEVDYDNTIVRAPFAGVVVAKAAQPGEIISPISAGGGFTRTGIGTIVDMDSLEIEVDVNEAFINRVQPGQPVEAVLDAYPDWRIPGTVIAIIPTADRSKATVKVRIALNERDARIVPEMGVRVAFLDDQADADQTVGSGVLVPATAIVQRDQHTVVFVVDGNRVHRRPVTAGPGYGAMRLVAEGLQPGDEVVRDPPAALQDGMRVSSATPRS